MVRMKHVTPAETLANLQSLLLMTISGTAGTSADYTDGRTARSRSLLDAFLQVLIWSLS